MSCDTEAAAPDGVLYRVARGPAPWTWPDWAYAESDGTFGHRYDDPDGEYRVLYASSQRLGDDIENRAICEPATVATIEMRRLQLDDPDLQRAMELFRLEILAG